MCSNCPDVFLFGKNWTTRSILVSEHIGTIRNKMGISLCQNVAKTVNLHPSNQKNYRQICHGVNQIEDRKLGLFQDVFAGDVRDSKTTSGGSLCAFGSHTFVPISWMRKKQTAVTHSTAESLASFEDV